MSQDRIEIHVFSDASESAIATVIYIKSVSMEGDICTALLYAQAKLSPKQATTIPRLELCAAVLSVNAVRWVIRELKLNIRKTVFYTDSKVVLGYIQSESKRFYVYVANRVEIIRSVSHPTQWRFVESKENPADIATRGKTPLALENSIWFTGPDFLKLDSLPQDLSAIEINQEDLEVRKEIITYASRTKLVKAGLGSERFQRFSSWFTLRTALAMLIRKITSFKARRSGRTTCNLKEITPPQHLSLPYLRKAENIMIKTVQKETYGEEMQILENLETHEQTVLSQMKKSSLYRLQPFLDNTGTLRVGGRLRRADMDYGEKHPAILPKSSQHS